jgi:hypothetical protein
LMEIRYIHIRPFVWWFVLLHEKRHVAIVESTNDWIEANRKTMEYDRRSLHGILFWRK